MKFSLHLAIIAFNSYIIAKMGLIFHKRPKLILVEKVFKIYMMKVLRFVFIREKCLLIPYHLPVPTIESNNIENTTRTKFFIFKFSFNYRNGPSPNLSKIFKTFSELDAKSKHAIVLCKFYAF